MAKKTKKKAKVVYKPIRTRYGRATTYIKGQEREIEGISTGNHPLDDYVFHIVDAYTDTHADVVIRDNAEDQKILKKLKRLEKTVRELRKVRTTYIEEEFMNGWGGPP